MCRLPDKYNPLTGQARSEVRYLHWNGRMYNVHTILSYKQSIQEITMKKNIAIIAAGIMVLAVMAAGAYAGEMTKTMTKDRLVGTTVKNLEGDKLGKISDVSFEQDGTITFAIMSHGGIAGYGEKLIPIPLNAMTFKEEKLAVVDIIKERLKRAPSFTRDTRPDMSSRTWAEDTSRFYGVRPYWEEKEMQPGTTHEMQEMKEEQMEKMHEMKEEQTERMRKMPMEKHEYKDD